jgi:hypothetical protein
LLLVEDTKVLITKAIGNMTDSQVAELMAPSDDVKMKRAETITVLKKLREAEQMLYNVARMDAVSLR